jgi:pimeloyl-ACP methyl ester carboxylesterase
VECMIRGVPIHYEVLGEGRPHLMLHGWPVDHSHVQYAMEPLFADRTGWRRIYPDLPGMGDTPSSPTIASQADLVEIVIEFIRAVAPGERFVVTGVSYGGYLARWLTHRYAADMDGFFAWAPAFRQGDSATVPPAQVLVPNPDLVASLAEDELMWAEANTVHSSTTLEEFRALIKPALAKADHAFLDRIAEGPVPADPPAMKEPFPAPSLILTGRQDSWCGYVDSWEVLEDYPRATFAVLDRAAHGLNGEQPTLFRVLVSEWLDRVEEYIAR